MSAAVAESRPLDTVERFWLVRAERGGGICVAIAVVEGRLDREQVESAARRLHRRHPLLDTRIADAADPRFECRYASGPELRWRQGDPLRDWTAVADDETATPFSPDGPLWRLTVIDGGHAVVAAVVSAHHAIVDGQSCFRLLRELFELCNDDTPEAPATSLPRPLGELVELTPRTQTGPGGVPHRAFPVLGRAPVEHRRTRSLHRVIEPAVHARLQARLKQERTTIHAAVCTAALFATCDTIGPYESLQVVSPISLRPLCRPPARDDVIACYASGMAVFSSMTERVDFWERTRLYHRELFTAMKAEAWRMDPLTDPAALGTARDAHAHAIDDGEQQGRVGDIVVSSSANFPRGERWGAFVPVACYEAAAQHTTGHHVGLYPHTVGDQLCLSAVYVAPVWTADYAHAFVDRVVGWLVDSA